MAGMSKTKAKVLFCCHIILRWNHAIDMIQHFRDIFRVLNISYQLLAQVILTVCVCVCVCVCVFRNPPLHQEGSY